MADLIRHPKDSFFPLLLAKRICVWSMYQTSLSLSLSLRLAPSLPLRDKVTTRLATSCLANDIHPYGNGGGGEGFRCRFGPAHTPETGRHNRLATFMACMLNGSHTNSVLSPHWPLVKISLILGGGLYFLRAWLGTLG